MNIDFKVIRFRNFLSCGENPVEINLNQHNLTLIVGHNGAGKSTILDALAFCLFKKPFRKVNLPLLVNSVTNKNCVVELEFEIDDDKYKIIRGIKPNKFEIFKNDTLVNHTNNDDYQEYLEKNILHINHKAFCQVVVLGSASYTPFLELPAPDRRKIIENLLDLEIFSTMNVLLKKRIQDNDRSLRDAQNISRNIQEQYQQISELQQGQIQKDNEKISDLESILEKLRKDIREKQKYIKENKIDKETLDEYIRRHLDISKQIQTYQSDIRIYQNDKEKLAKEIEFYNANGVCRVCKQEIDEGHKHNIIGNNQENIEKLDYKIFCITEHIKKHTDILESILDQKKILEDKKTYQDKTEFEINSLIKQGVDTKILVDKLKNSVVNDYSTVIKELEAKLQFANSSYDETSKKAEVMNIALKLLKDDGIKANIIAQYIEVMNELINSFLLEMDFICQFNIDENFNEVIKSRYRDEFIYSSFSEGEKMRIDLALLLTWREVASRRNSIRTNILFFDEVLDSSLDTDGIEGYLNILKKLTSRQNVFIISHNDKNIDRIENVIRFEKVKGFSRVA